MTGYELYTFILCTIVLVSLTALFVTFLRLLVKFYLKLVRNGIEDEAILAEAEKDKSVTAIDVINNIVSAIVCIVLIVAFLFSLTVQLTEHKHPFGLPTLTVVKSSSMSYKEESNQYLFKNQLDDQFDTFDILLVEELPDEYDLKLYDIVVYEAKDGTPIVHRIVGIEEPNDSHPDCRYFKFQGDAVQASDRFPVLYEQMKGIYSGERIRFVGSFVMFMQSPAGWICILLVILAIIATPIIEKKIEYEKELRLALLAQKDEGDDGDTLNDGDSEPEVADEAETSEPPEEPCEAVLLLVPEITKERDYVLALSRSRKADIRAFGNKLSLSSAEAQKYYVLASECLGSIKGIRYGYSSQYQTFKLGDRTVARLTLRRGTVTAYVNADADKLAELCANGAEFGVTKDASFAEYPVVIRLDSDLNMELLRAAVLEYTEGTV